MGNACTKPDNVDREHEDFVMQSKGVGTSHPKGSSQLTFKEGSKNFWVVNADNLKSSHSMFSNRPAPQPLRGDRSPELDPTFRQRYAKVDQNGDVLVGKTIKPLNKTVNTFKMANASHQVDEDMLTPEKSVYSSKNVTPFARRGAQKASFYMPGNMRQSRQTDPLNESD